jgi:hypothetical protein
MSDQNTEHQPEESITRTIQVADQAGLRVIDELEMIARDREGTVVREFSMRSDGRKEGNVDIDRTGSEERMIVSGRIVQPMDRQAKVADENDYAARLAKALSERWRIPVEVEPKDAEHSDVPDVWLRTPQGKVPVQVTHFDTQIVSALGHPGAFSTDITPQQIGAAAVQAIQRKQHVDRALAATTYLLLICPYPIREAMQPAIRQQVAASAPQNAYCETWVASLNEPTFQVQ